MDDIQSPSIDQPDPNGTPTDQLKVSDWTKKFTASERVMRADFLPKYQLAKLRLRAEHEVKGKGTRKLTHEQVDLTYSIGTNFVNSVYYKSPECNLTAREEVDHQKIENTEVAVNDWLKDKKVKKVIKRIIWDAYVGGFGAVFLDYEYDDMPSGEPLTQTSLVAGPDGVPAPQETPVLDERGQPQMKKIVLKNEITIQRIRPDLLRFPRGFDFDNFQESPWIGFDLIIPIEEVKNNEEWDQEVRDKIEGEKYDKLSVYEKQSAPRGDDGSDLYAKISYCFVKPDNPQMEPFKLLIFSQKNDDKPLFYGDFKKGHVGYPLKFLYFNPLDDDTSYPNGDPWIFESQLNAVDEWWRKVTNHVRRSNPKIAYDSGNITPEEAGKLKSNNDNELVGISNKKGLPLANLLQELNAPRVNGDLDKMWEIARQLVSEIAPRSSLASGAGGTTNTATEAKIVQSGDMIDLDARIDDVSDHIKDIVLDVAGIMEESLAAPIPLKREDPNGGPDMFDQVDSDGFTSKITIDVDVESMQAQNKDVIRRQLIDSLGLFDQLKPFFDQLGEMPDPKFWLERVMETMHVRNIDKGFIPIPAMAMLPPPGQAPPPGAGAPPSGPTGAMPPEATEAGLAQRT